MTRGVGLGVINASLLDLKCGSVLFNYKGQSKNITPYNYAYHGIIGCGFNDP